jgi:hypothetical protein
MIPISDENQTILDAIVRESGFALVQASCGDTYESTRGYAAMPVILGHADGRQVRVSAYGPTPDEALRRAILSAWEKVQRGQYHRLTPVTSG